MELSRRFRALKLWLSLRYHGLEAFRAAIQKDLDQSASATVWQRMLAKAHEIVSTWRCLSVL